MSSESALIIIIAGGSASGKSTIVSRFVELTGAAHISHDRYYLDAPDPKGYDFDHPDALDTVALIADVVALKAGREVLLPVYDFASHKRTPEAEGLKPSPIIVVEGILVLAEARLAALADLSVFVEAPEEVRLNRRIARDVAERGRSPQGVRAQFEATVKPNHDRFVQPSKVVADLVLDGTRPPDVSVAELMSRAGLSPG
jgi:uridine kinase